MYIAAISSGPGRSLRSRGFLRLALAMALLAPCRALSNPGAVIPISYVTCAIKYTHLAEGLEFINGHDPLEETTEDALCSSSWPSRGQWREAWAPRVFLRHSN
jgi:hypothetical protein